MTRHDFAMVVIIGHTCHDDDATAAGAAMCRYLSGESEPRTGLIASMTPVEFDPERTTFRDVLNGAITQQEAEEAGDETN